MHIDDDMITIMHAYETYGIVTRIECPNLDSRPLSDKIMLEMKKRGYEEALMTETHLEGFIDYSRAIYNPDRFTNKEADEYLVRYVLKER